MRRRLIGMGLACVFCATGLNGHAQDQADPVYEVEVLVFEHLNQSDRAYRWPGEPVVNQSVDLLPPLRGQDSADTAPNSGRFQLSSRSGLGLGDAWSRLRQSRPYRPLAHVGWRQPALDGNASIPVRIRNDNIVSVAQAYSDRPDIAMPSGPVLQVDGSATFEQRRYKHIRLDLAMHRQAPIEMPVENPAPPVDTEQDTAATLPTRSLEPLLPYRTYRINDSRQVRIGQVHYFDHRQFGVLVRVSEVGGE